MKADAPAAVAELRSAADVASWLAIGLALRRVHDDQDHGPAILACANELPALPPPGVIADLSALLGGARVGLATPLAAAESLRAAIRAYDDDVLARLVMTPRFDDVLAAYAHLAAADQPAAVALVVGAICERSGFGGASVSPATLRRALLRPREEREADGRVELAGGPMAELVASAYLQLARGARQCRALVDDRDVFAVDHLSVLRDLGGRMTADHIASAADALGRTLPRRLPARREQRGSRDTNLADDSLYPAGGFSAIMPGGANANIENLVASELAYMEDDDAASPDVFTVRYVEGELLYYTRDDSVFRRRRHVIGIALGEDLDDARVKDRDLPWQRLVLSLGLVVAAVRWLGDQLGDEALAIRIAFPPKLLAEEREILALLLDAEIARGMVVITAEPRSAAAAASADAGHGAIADLIVISAGPVPATPPLPRGLRALHVDVSGAAPVVSELAPRRSDAGAETGDAWRQWGEAAEDVLRWLV
jgi:hypothetical protein